MLTALIKSNFNKLRRSCTWHRLVAIVWKEFIQIRRDRVTFGMIIGIPLMQLILFGYAINTNPKHLPTVIMAADYGPYTRAFLYGLKNTQYFKVTDAVKNEAEAARMMETGKTQFIISIPVDFSRKLLRGERPALLVEADATDPVATGSAISAIRNMVQNMFGSIFHGEFKGLRASLPPVDVITHANYNAESITQYNIVPGLLGVVLTMTMVMITGMGITREREKGTMEHLLATPVTALEVMLGKIAPYIIIGYIQVALILCAAKFLFRVPFQGSVLLLVICALPFIAANLAMGLTFSSLAKSQLQSANMSVFFFLPSMLLSGFMFPFYGMPLWAQKVGSILPLTYFLRVTRGVVLKGNSFLQVWPNLWPILLFMVVAMAIGLTRYRRTLD